MSDRDVVIGSMATVPQGPGAKTLPAYLVKILPESNAKNSTSRFFIAVEKHEFPGHIHVKGFYSEQKEADIAILYRELVSQADSASILELWLPWHSIHSIRSLVFKTSSRK